MERVTAPADAERIIGALGVLGGRDRTGIDSVLAAVEWLQVPAGERLFSVGDPPDGMYVIASGRVRFFAEDRLGAVETAEAGEGVAFGEGSLLVGGGRSRSAVVVRDALLARLSPAQFRELIALSPAMATGVAQRMARRISVEERSRTSSIHGAEHIAVVDDGVGPAMTGWLATALGDAIGSVVSEGCQPCAPSPSIVVTAGGGQICRHAARVLVVVPAADLPQRFPPIRRALEAIDPLARPITDLVLLRPRRERRPPQSGAWLARHEPGHHYFVTEGDAADIERLGRHISGRARLLVLGGGGARGMAHIGVLRALEEMGVAVDAVGGSSSGAVVAAQLASGWTLEEMVERNRDGWKGVRRVLDFTFPTVSISSGRSMRRLMERWFDESQVEDLPLPCFCTTVNLSRFRLDVHTSGPLAQWVLASCSAPGLWPPVVDGEGELHVDGGQLNNVPTDVMRQRHDGIVLAVDVASEQRAMTVPRDATPRLGLRHLVGNRGARFPSLADTLGRCALLGSLQQREQAAAHADVYLTPDCSSIGFSSFKRIDAAIAIGYHAAIDALSDLDLSSLASAR